jgi:hypothetical protein
MIENKFGPTIVQVAYVSITPIPAFVLLVTNTLLFQALPPTTDALVLTAELLVVCQ